jgi:ubiquinol-cytochrome c reductase cytochrome b subunit
MSALRYVAARSGLAPAARRGLRYVFPEHWSFMLGEIALYAFVVLVTTGIYLALFFDPNTAPTTYHGSYAPLDGMRVSHAYASTVHLSLDVEGGLLIRQTHHWAALVFLAAIVLHLIRVFFTGAFRRPRELTWYVGLLMLTLALIEGFAGYSLPDDLLSGMGLAIAYSVVLSLPLIGAPLSHLAWGGEFPATGGAFESRLYILHVFLIPIALGVLIAVHLTFVALLKHTQFPGPGRTERNVVGAPLWPRYAMRSLSLFLAVVAMLVLLGGLVQINPVWQWGPYEPYLATNGAQPDWYLGWLIGALRLMPPVEGSLFGFTFAPNPLFGGVLVPLIVFGLLFAWPTLERRRTGDDAEHNLLDRPSLRPGRTAVGAALMAFVGVTFIAGSADRIALHLGIAYTELVQMLRAAAVLLPPLTFLVVRAACRGSVRATATSDTPRPGDTGDPTPAGLP